MNLYQWEYLKDKFMEHLHHERNIAENSLYAYGSDFKLFKSFWEKLGEDAAYEMSYDEVKQRFIQNMYNNKLSRNTIARKYSCFNSFGKFLESEGFKATFLKIPKKHLVLPRYLTEKEILFLLDKISHKKLRTSTPYRDMAILELLYSTGIRSSELCKIKLCHLNLKDVLLKITGKGRKDRMVIFGRKARSRIRRYLKYERSKDAQDASTHLFLSVQDTKGIKALSTRSIQYIIAKFSRFLANDKKVAPHTIRHTFATHLMDKGMDLRMIQQLMGHTDIGTTEKYTHVSMEKLKSTCELVHPLNDFKKK